MWQVQWSRKRARREGWLLDTCLKLEAAGRTRIWHFNESFQSSMWACLVKWQELRNQFTSADKQAEWRCLSKMSRGVLQVFVARLEACRRSFEVSFQSTPNAVYTDNNRFWSAVFEFYFPLFLGLYIFSLWLAIYAVGVEDYQLFWLSHIKLLLLCCNIQMNICLWSVHNVSVRMTHF